MTMQLKTVVPRTTSRLDLWRRLIDRALERALPKASAIPPVVHEGMRYCVFSGGKRFRPLLCLGAAAAVGAPSRVALPVACALELIHTYSLVHDDLPAMDNADQRRGQPACHRKFGEGNAILIGDALLTLAFDLMSRHEMPNALAIIHTVSTACGTTGLIGGQVLDLQAISRPHGASEETLKEIARWKTGALIGASVVSGGLAGSANSHQIKYLQGYGRNIGLAFQLIDDIHDREGFVNRLGLDEARAQAHNLIAHAIDMVKPFGTEAAGLRQIAQWLASTAS